MSCLPLDSSMHVLILRTVFSLSTHVSCDTCIDAPVLYARAKRGFTPASSKHIFYAHAAEPRYYSKKAFEGRVSTRAYGYKPSFGWVHPESIRSMPYHTPPPVSVVPSPLTIAVAPRLTKRLRNNSLPTLHNKLT